MSVALKPVMMGLVMGPMMLWMLHGAMAGDALSALAVLVFVAAHLLLVGLVMLAGFFAARLSAHLRHRIARLHRPNAAHFGQMIVSAAAAAFCIHLVIHGTG